MTIRFPRPGSDTTVVIGRLVTSLQTISSTMDTGAVLPLPWSFGGVIHTEVLLWTPSGHGDTGINVPLSSVVSGVGGRFRVRPCSLYVRSHTS